MPMARHAATKEESAMRNRVIVATLAGVFAGLSCWLGGQYVFGYVHSPLQVANTLGQRTLIGFVIGISALRMNWQLHGLTLGLIVGAPFALGHLMSFTDTWLDTAVGIMLFPLGAFYGWAIELITTKIFRLPARTA
jgi:hypothetical protein